MFDRVLDRNGSLMSLYISLYISNAGAADIRFTTYGVNCEFVGELQQDVESMTNARKGLVQLLFISLESLLSNP